MELHPSFWYSSGSFPHSSGWFLHSYGSPLDAPPELSASEVLQTSLGPYWTLSEIKGTILRWGAQCTSWGQSPSESVILTPPRDCMHLCARSLTDYDHYGLGMSLWKSQVTVALCWIAGYHPCATCWPFNSISLKWSGVSSNQALGMAKSWWNVSSRLPSSSLESHGSRSWRWLSPHSHSLSSKMFYSQMYPFPRFLAYQWVIFSFLLHRNC
jgi:hypothetical protein